MTWVDVAQVNLENEGLWNSLAKMRLDLGTFFSMNLIWLISLLIILLETEFNDNMNKKRHFTAANVKFGDFFLNPFMLNFMQRMGKIAKIEPIRRKSAKKLFLQECSMHLKLLVLSNSNIFAILIPSFKVDSFDMKMEHHVPHLWGYYVISSKI